MKRSDKALLVAMIPPVLVCLALIIFIPTMSGWCIALISVLVWAGAFQGCLEVFSKTSIIDSEIINKKMPRKNTER